MPQYVLRHGAISLGSGNASAGVPLMPSADPLHPTLFEATEEEAARINGDLWDAKAKKAVPMPKQSLPGSRDKGPCLQLKAEYDAEKAAEIAAAKARAEVLAKAKAAPVEKPKTDEKKGGGK